MNQVIARIFEIFEQQNIHTALQKGHGVSLYYDKPDRRVCGDIDLFFPDKADYYKANIAADGSDLLSFLSSVQ